MPLFRTTPLPARVARAARSPRSITFASGALGGLYLFDWTHQFVATFGASWSATAALAIAVALGCELGVRSLARDAHHVFRGLWTTSLALALYAAAFPLGLVAARGLVSLIPLDTMAKPFVGFAFALAVALPLVTAPTLGLVRLLCELPRALRGASGTAPRDETGGLVRFGLWGTGCGLLAGVFVLAPTIGVHATALCAAAVAGSFSLYAAYREWKAGPSAGDDAATSVSTTPAVAAAQHAASHRRAQHSALVPDAPVSPRWLSVLPIVALLGAGTALAERMAYQWMPASAYLVYCLFAALAAGAALGIFWKERRLNRGAAPNAAAWAGAACLIAACWTGLCLALFGLMVNGALAAASSISRVWLLMILRAATIASLVLPYAFGWGLLSGASGRRESEEPRQNGAAPAQSGRRSWQFAAWTAGFLSVRGLFAFEARAADLWAGLAIAFLVLGAICLLAARAVPRRWPARVACAAAACLALAAPWLRSTYDPSLSARLLFSTNVFMARQANVEREFLPFLDAGRLAQAKEGDRGTYTAWKHHGAQYQWRVNGIPLGTASTDPGICPHFSSEVLPAVLSLTLHENPRNVLLLGLGSGVPLATCLAFPTEHVTCVEGDAALIDLMGRTAWRHGSSDPRRDDRLHLVTLDPALAAGCRGGEYDVVLACSDNAAVWQAAPYYTREFYEAAARRTGSRGLFAQRFQQVDFGVWPLEMAVHTLQQVFADVAAVESGPGELLLLATNSEEGIVHDRLLARMQTPQVRRALSHIGWDWTVPLNLNAYPNDALSELAASSRSNSAANGRFAFRIPQEVMRWGAKGQEQYAALAPRASRLLGWENVPDNDPDVLRRLAEVSAQANVMTAYPDQPWAYRKAARTALEDRPRSLIQQVSRKAFDRGLHPDDKRRLDYFTALGRAAQQAKPSEEDIRAIVEFEAPYDPLVSYFLHQEVAGLYARRGDDAKGLELRHRLHAIYYSNPADRSVRDLVDALALLAAYPQACPDPAERWDHMNSLLQILKTRWETRGAVEPKAPRIVLNDLEKSISAVETSFETMDSLHADARVPESDWLARKAYLERSVVRPLRTYRSRLLPYHLKMERKQQQLSEEAAEELSRLPGDLGIPEVE